MLYEEASEKEYYNGIRDLGRPPVTLQYFVTHPNAQAASLSAAHVVALRLYSTHLFKYLNGPLRLEAFGFNKLPHPLPMTMTFLNEGIKKLRIVHAIQKQEESLASSSSLLASFIGNTFRPNRATVKPLAQQRPTTLWRGMRNMHVAEAFMEHSAGGSEVYLDPLLHKFGMPCTQARALCQIVKLTVCTIARI